MRPFTAAFRLASVPVTVIDDEPLEPAVTETPVVDASVRVPSVTESVSESDVPEAAVSVRLIELLKNVYWLFSLTVTGAGTLTLGAGLTVRATTSASDSTSPESATDICSQSEPV